MAGTQELAESSLAEREKKRESVASVSPDGRLEAGAYTGAALLLVAQLQVPSSLDADAAVKLSEAASALTASHGGVPFAGKQSILLLLSRRLRQQHAWRREIMSTHYEIIWPAFCLTHRRKSIGDFFVPIESSISFLLPRRTSAGDVAGSNRLVADALKPPPVAGEVAIDRICLIDE